MRYAPCAYAGYYCPSHPFPPSTNARQNACGGSALYCPAGTGNADSRRPVSAGYYTVGGDADNTQGLPLNATR